MQVIETTTLMFIYNLVIISQLNFLIFCLSSKSVQYFCITVLAFCYWEKNNRENSLKAGEIDFILQFQFLAG